MGGGEEGVGRKSDIRCDTRINEVRYRKEVRSSYMKHDDHFQPCAYGITAAKSKSRSKVDQERKSREWEWGEEEGIPILG